MKFLNRKLVFVFEFKSCKKHLLDVSPNLYVSLSAILAAFYEKFCSHDSLLFYERHPYWLIQSEQKQKAINFLFIDHRGGKLMTPHIAKQKFFQVLFESKNVFQIYLKG